MGLERPPLLCLMQASRISSALLAISLLREIPHATIDVAGAERRRATSRSSSSSLPVSRRFIHVAKSQWPTWVWTRRERRRDEAHVQDNASNLYLTV